MNRRILVLAGLGAAILLVAASSPGAAQVGICSDVTAITSRAEKGAALNIAEFDEDIFATRQLCNFGLGDWPTAGEILDLLTGSTFLPPAGTAFPVSPVTGETFIILDDSAAGACDSAAGSAQTNCRWNGAAWVAVGDGGGSVGFGAILTGTNTTATMTVDSGASIVATGSGDVEASSVQVDTVTNAGLADMATDTVKLRNASGTGDPEDVKISALTEQGTPVAGDFLLCETAAGDLRKCDVGDLPAAGGSFLPLAGGTMTGAITMQSADPDINFDDTTGNDWRITNNAGTLQLFNTTDVLSYLDVGPSGLFHINPTGAIAGDFQWEADSNVNGFFCDASLDGGTGRCGIGTGIPEAKLDIALGTGNIDLQLRTDGGEATIILNSGGANNDSEILFEDDDTLTWGFRMDTSVNQLLIREEVAGFNVLNFDLTTGVAVFNENGTATADLRWEADTDVNGIFCDATGSGACGFGTSTPDGRVHVHTATAGAVTANAGADDLVIENSDSGGITILAPDANDANLFFGSPGSSTAGRFRWNHDAALMTIGTGFSGADLRFMTGAFFERMRIDSDGAVIINEDGLATADVRMESDTNANMFLVDTSGNQVGIGTATMGAGADLTVNDILHIVPLATAPANCVIGNFYVDTSGAYCGCSVVDTWENMLATGTCA